MKLVKLSPRWILATFFALSLSPLSEASETLSCDIGVYAGWLGVGGELDENYKNFRDSRLFRSWTNEDFVLNHPIEFGSKDIWVRQVPPSARTQRFLGPADDKTRNGALGVGLAGWTQGRYSYVNVVYSIDVLNSEDKNPELRWLKVTFVVNGRPQVLRWAFRRNEKHAVEVTTANLNQQPLHTIPTILSASLQCRRMAPVVE